MSWLDNYIDEKMKDPEYKKTWEKYQPVSRIFDYMVENDIPFSFEFLDLLEELNARGVAFELPTDSVRNSNSETQQKAEMTFA